MGDGGEYYKDPYCNLIGDNCQGRPKGACGVCRTRADYQARLAELETEQGLAELAQ